MGIYNDLIFTEALDQVKAILAETDQDRLADRLELIAVNQDLSLSCLFLFVLHIRGVDLSELNGVTLANVQPTMRDFILPEGLIGPT